MALDLTKEKGIPLDRQQFTWRDMVQMPISKLDDDAFTRVRVILMNGLEMEMNRFGHALARFNDGEMRRAIARTRRAEQHQQTTVNWLLGPDHSPLETTIGYEQVAIEVTAAVAQSEPDPYLAQVYRFGLLEDFDHMYRFASLMDRVEGKDANTILQSYTDILPGRPTSIEHRHPDDDVRDHFDRTKAAPITKINALTIMSAENQTHDYYMTIGPMFADPIARQLYAEIASIEEQHTTHYESMLDPRMTWMESWLLHEAMEIYNYMTCAAHETNPRIKQIWTRFCDYEIGHLQFAMECFKKFEKRDPMEVLPKELPEPMSHSSQRDFVRKVLKDEVHKRAAGTKIVDQEPANSPSKAYRDQLNSKGSPSELVAAGYKWRPGTELVERAASIPEVHA